MPDWLVKQQKFILAQFWSLEVQDQGDSKIAPVKLLSFGFKWYLLVFSHSLSSMQVQKREKTLWVPPFLMKPFLSD